MFIRFIIIFEILKTISSPLKIPENLENLEYFGNSVSGTC